jgi:hypothetical protein
VDDASRIRCNPGIFAGLHWLAANILRFKGVRNVADGRHRIAIGALSARYRRAKYRVSATACIFLRIRTSNPSAPMVALIVFR